jgi:GNAT superfamily N-acetyltransferase
VDPSFLLREARPEDVPAIVGLIRELAAYERQPQDCHADPALLREHLFGSRRYCEAVMAEARGAPCGFALFFHNYSTWRSLPGLYLEDLYVQPAFRVRGIGRALLARLAEIAVSRGCGRMEWSVLKWNEPAIGFYRKLGAVPMEAWQVYRLEGEPLAALGSGAPFPGRNGAGGPPPR